MKEHPVHWSYLVYRGICRLSRYGRIRGINPSYTYHGCS
nr:MAG TPA: hypothetical protein [Caudoviricetes sp.]